MEVRGLAAGPVREASFVLHRGEVLGVFGLMGSGRTEMVRALFGLDPAESGSVTGPRGPDGPRASPARRLRQGFGYLSEDRKGEGLALPLSVADNVTMTRFSSCSRMGILDIEAQRSQATDRAREVQVRMHGPDQAVGTLSGGNQQKVALARLLHQDADVLLLDEPTRGIDVASKTQMYQVIASAAAAGKAVLVISSYLPELLGICDRLAVMSRGRLGPARPVGLWSPESIMEAAIGT
jgi:ribose transport system ATP-binding protein